MFSSGEYESPLAKKWLEYCKTAIPIAQTGRSGHDECRPLELLALDPVRAAEAEHEADHRGDEGAESHGDADGADRFQKPGEAADPNGIDDGDTGPPVALDGPGTERLRESGDRYRNRGQNEQRPPPR